MKEDEKDGFGLEVIAEGSCSMRGHTITVIVIRLNDEAIGQWDRTVESIGGIYCSEDDAAWVEWKGKLDEWEKKILGRLKIGADIGYEITQSLDEIFTIAITGKERVPAIQALRKEKVRENEEI